jgi:uncharacterized membrane protein YdjX (TVP38/TMEM64 family)
MSIKIKLIIIALAGVIIVALYNFTPLGDLIDLQKIVEQKELLLLRVRENYILSALGFVLLYIAATALSIPGATVLSLLGGFFFGPYLGVLLINMGATTGALLIFLAARYFLGKDVQKKYSKKLAQFNREVAKNGKNYFLTLRLIPLFPFFLINLLSGFTNVKVFTFIWTTAIGIIPGSFVYAYLGSTGAATGEDSSFGIKITIALILLGLLSLLPVLMKKLGKTPEGETKEETL